MREDICDSMRKWEGRGEGEEVEGLWICSRR